MLIKNIKSQEYETGIVKEISGKDAIVELAQSEACKSCGARVVCTPDSKGERIIRTENTIDAQVGQQVRIDENSGVTLKITGFQYGIPLIGFIIGLLISYLLNLQLQPVPDELVQFIYALLGLFVFARISKWYIKEFTKKHFYFFSIKS